MYLVRIALPLILTCIILFIEGDFFAIINWESPFLIIPVVSIGLPRFIGFELSNFLFCIFLWQYNKLKLKLIMQEISVFTNIVFAISFSVVTSETIGSFSFKNKCASGWHTYIYINRWRRSWYGYYLFDSSIRFSSNRLISCTVFNHNTFKIIFIAQTFSDTIDYEEKRLVSLLCKLVEIKNFRVQLLFLR